MISGLKRKLITLATTTLSILAVFSENPAKAGALSFEATYLDPTFSVTTPSNKLGKITVKNLSGFIGFNGIVEESQNIHDSVHLDTARNPSSDLMGSVNAIDAESNTKSWIDAETDTENPWFFEVVIISMSFMGGLMTLTPMMIVKSDRSKIE